MTSSSSSIDSSDLAPSSLPLHIPNDFLSFHSAPVLCSSFNSTIHTVTMVVHFDVDNKGNEYQQFRFVLFFELTSLIRKQKNPSINSVFSYKSLQALRVGTRRILQIYDMIFDIRTNNMIFDIRTNNSAKSFDIRTNKSATKWIFNMNF